MRRAHDYDELVALACSRDTRARRHFVERLGDYLRRTYRAEFENEADPRFAQQVTLTLERARGTSPAANTVQMLLVLVGVFLETPVRDYFCPPPPAAEADPATGALVFRELDSARVDRLRFLELEQHILPAAARQLLDGGLPLATVGFVQDVVDAYTAIQPADPQRPVARAPFPRARDVALLRRTATDVPPC